MAGFSIVNRSPDGTTYFAQDSMFNWTYCYIVEMVQNNVTQDYITLQIAGDLGGGFGPLYFRLYGNFSFTQIEGTYGGLIPAVAAGSIIERVEVINGSGTVYNSVSGLNFAFNTAKTSTEYDDANVFANSFRPGEVPVTETVFAGNDYVDGNSGSEVLHGYGGNDTVLGYGGIDGLYGDAGNDSLVGGSGQPNDLYGGDGNDTIAGYVVGDYIDGGAGTDTWGVTGTYSTGIGLSPNLDLRGAEVYGIEVLRVTYGNIVVDETQVGGTTGVHTVIGGSQYRDALVVRATDDGSSTGRVVDLSTVTFQNWNVNTQDSDPISIEGTWLGGDTLSGGAQPERINAGNGNNQVAGNGGNDYLYAFDGADTIQGGSGDDSLLGGAGNDVLEGDAPALGFYAVTGNDRLEGGGGDDLLRGGFGANIIDGGSGIDTVSYREASAGDFYTQFWLVVDLSKPVNLAADNYDYNGVITFVEVPGGQEEVFVGDKIFGVENVEGTDYVDFITGDGAANRLSGWAGGDWLTGGAGNDTLVGGADDDALSGGDGFDIASYANAPAAVSVSLALTTWQDTGGAGPDSLAGMEGLGGSAWADTLAGDSMANLLAGGNGNDTLDGGAGNDTLQGGAGTDAATYAAAGAGVTVSLALTGAQNTVGAGTDTLSGIERLVGSAFADSLTGSGLRNALGGGAGADILRGGAGIDTLNGGVGNDSLSGGAGEDVLLGSAGADRLAGGTEADLFQFSSLVGADTLLDFQSGSDRMQVLQAGITVGDGDALLEGARVVAGPGGFSPAAELVIVTTNLAGSLGAAAAAAAIGSASAPWTLGDSALFAVDNGSASAVYLFRALDTDAAVEAAELTLLATLQGTASTASGDYLLGA